jgi:hypothetical protein
MGQITKSTMSAEICTLLSILAENFGYIRKELSKVSFVPDASDIDAYFEDCETLETVIDMLTTVSECVENLVHYVKVRNDKSSK